MLVLHFNQHTQPSLCADYDQKLTVKQKDRKYLSVPLLLDSALAFYDFVNLHYNGP